MGLPYLKSASSAVHPPTCGPKSLSKLHAGHRGQRALGGLVTVPFHVEKLHALVCCAFRVEIEMVPSLKIETLPRAHRSHPGITIRIQEIPHMQFFMGNINSG